MLGSKTIWQKVYSTKRPIIVAIYCLICFLCQAQTKTWNGSVNSDWNNANNWVITNSLPGWPDFYQIKIPPSPNNPIISGSNTALSVDIDSNATLTIVSGASMSIYASMNNKGTVHKYGNLTIGGFGFTYLVTALDPDSLFVFPPFLGGLINIANFNNYSGNFTCGIIDNQSGTFNNSYIINNQILNNKSNFNNLIGGIIKVNTLNTDTIPATLSNQSGVFNNYGKLEIGSSTKIGLVGLVNSAIFNNNLGGEIYIDRSSLGGLVNGASSIFNNNAKIEIGSLDTIGDFALTNSGLFNNNVNGQIRLNRAALRGLINSNIFNNQSIIEIGLLDTVGQYGLVNSGIFNNKILGEININKSSFIGLANDGTFNNDSKVKIGQLSNVGLYGLVNTGTFENNDGGEVNIDRSTDFGLIQFSGEFNNFAKVFIGLLAPILGKEMVVFSPFNNKIGGDLILKRY